MSDELKAKITTSTVYCLSVAIQFLNQNEHAINAMVALLGGFLALSTFMINWYYRRKVAQFILTRDSRKSGIDFVNEDNPQEGSDKN